MIQKNCKKPINKYRIQVNNFLNKRKVVNISGIKLTHSETSILSKGLNFCPTQTEMKKQDIYKNIDDFKRKISLKVLFRNTENSTQNNSYKSTNLDKIIRNQNKNPFQPPHEHCVQAYADALKDEIQYCKRNHPKQNTTKREMDALKRLSERTDIVIKRADKGGATVVCSANWYEEEAARQLNNSNYYKKVSQDYTKKHEDMIKEKLKEFSKSKLITEKLAKQLEPSESRTPEFYLLPKIHKKNTPGRPVISSSGCHTEKISAYADQYLLPAAKALPSHIKDTDDFIDNMKRIGKVNENDILVTLDVSSLYTNICNEEGIEAIKHNNTLTSTLTKPVINMISTLRR